MISENELLALMADLESDRIERTISTTDTTKFREAICAFSNDFPNHRLPGFLLIGVEDKTGKACGLKADDALLRNLAGLRQDGEILPQPTTIPLSRKPSAASRPSKSPPAASSANPPAPAVGCMSGSRITPPM
jgi:predicted HTH transcriptional regulator